MPVTSYSRTPASNDSAPPNGAPENWAPSAVNDTVRQIMADIANEASKGQTRVLSSVAGTNTVTGSLSPALDAYSAGMIVVMTPAGNNTGATTLNINSLGALDIFKQDGRALAGGDLVSGVPALLVLDSGADDFCLMNPQTENVRFVAKSSDETVNNSSTLQDDDHLTLSNISAGTYVLKIELRGTAASSTPALDFKIEFDGSFSSGSSLVGIMSLNGTPSLAFLTTAAGLGTTRSTAWITGSQPNKLQLEGVIELTGSGTLKLQWAQSSAHASDTVLSSGSYIQIRKII